MGSFCSKSPENNLSVHSEVKLQKPLSPSRSRSPSCSSRGEGLDVRDFYRLGRVLGSGQFGKVRRAVSVFDPSLEVAVKSIDKTKIKTPETFMREVEILRLMDHPNIVKIFETFEDSKSYHIVMELCQGKELIICLGDLGGFDEKRASSILIKILSAVNYMHKHGICHRDLKLENFIGTCKETETEIKLIDFGLSRKFCKPNSMRTVVGTPYYVAPEVVSGNYSEKCDIWSCGVILFMILSGKMPFNGWDTEDLVKQICTLKIEFKGPHWANVSELAKDLVLKLLNRDVQARLSAEEALKHEWFSIAEQRVLDLSILSSLKTFKIRSSFQREALYLIARTLKYGQIKTLNDLFYELDTNKQGFLTVTDIKQCIVRSGLSIVESDLDLCLKNLDINGDGIIMYSDFLVAALHSKFLMDKDLVQESFRHFHSGSEKITIKDLQQVLYLNNTGIAPEVIFDEIDLNSESEISFQEFKKLILSV